MSRRRNRGARPRPTPAVGADPVVASTADAGTLDAEDPGVSVTGGITDTDDGVTDDGVTDDGVTDDGADQDVATAVGDTPHLLPPEVLEVELEEEEVERVAAKAAGPHRPSAVQRLYRGETSFDFVGRRRWWWLLSSLVIVAGIVSLGVRGLDLGITFKGGEAWTVKAPGITQIQAFDAVQAAGLSQPTVVLLGSGSSQQVRVTADLNNLSATARKAETTRVIHALAKLTKTTDDNVSVTTVGPTWGGQVTQKAVIALIVFLVLVAAYISVRFEPKMAIAAFVALLHDLLVTAGVYSLAGFQVTPDTVIAVLTILGYSLYDTVVVFDRVRDNTKGLGSSGRMTYSDMVNLSMNQTLARSINTSLVAILPVLAVLVIGAELLGATTLQNYGLALFIGLLSGAYSSIFIASPILAVLKEHEPRYIAVRQRVATRGDRLGLLTPLAAAALAGAAAGGGARPGARAAKAGKQPTLRPGQGRAGATRAAILDAPDATTATAGSAVRAGAGVGGNGRTTAAGRPAPARRPPQRPRKGGKGAKRRR